MKNYEKYADEIRGYKGTRFCKDFVKPNILKPDDCTNVGCARCKMLQMLWLLEDYEGPETDWSKVEVDTPILVKNWDNDKWEKRHFAKYENGIVYAWKDFCTSWTAYAGKYDYLINGKNVTAWKYAKLAESEEE